METPVNAIEHVHLLMDYLGQWPSFHDAEVITLHLDRKHVTLELTLAYVWRDIASGYGECKSPKCCTATLIFRGVSELHLDDFNEQNVLAELLIQRLNETEFTVRLNPVYGVRADFSCRDIEVFSVVPQGVNT